MAQGDGHSPQVRKPGLKMLLSLMMMMMMMMMMILFLFLLLLRCFPLNPIQTFPQIVQL